MSHEDVESRPGSIFIRNDTGFPALVLLCPVTRSGDAAMLCWDRMIATIAASTIHALVVIDKTKTGDASEYFLRKIPSIKAQLFIIRRDSTEQIFDSQKFIRLDDLLWIGQLHDDDHWEGNLHLPATGVERDNLFLCGFSVKTGDRITRLREEQMPPARVIFSWIPSRVWNRVCDFIYAQGGHIAGSVDFTIGLVASLSCRKRYLADFTYIYSDHHWGSRAEAEAHLRRLAVVDGWKEFSGSDIAILNRTLDNLSALVFCRQLVRPDEALSAYQRLMASFRPSLRKRLSVTSRLALSFALVIPVLQSRPSFRLNQLIAESWKVRTNGDILALIQKHLAPAHFPLLARRFQFWQEQLAALDEFFPADRRP